MRRRLVTAALAVVLLASLVFVVRLLVGESRAELENQGRDTEPRVFTSPRDRIRMVVPRAWRATDQPTYPGMLLWMMRSQPPGQIVLTAEAFSRELYCSWPISCRTAAESLTGKFACAVRSKLETQRIRVGPTQPGPKENEAAGLPSAWFEYEDGKRFLRQAVALSTDRAISLVLASPTNEARAAHVRSFDQMLRTLRLLTAAEATPPDAAVAIAIAIAPDGAPTLPSDGALADAGVTFESAPAPQVNPVGPCP